MSSILTVDKLHHGEQVGVQYKHQGVRTALLQLLHENDLGRPLLHCIVFGATGRSRVQGKVNVKLNTNRNKERN